MYDLPRAPFSQASTGPKNVGQVTRGAIRRLRGMRLKPSPEDRVLGIEGIVLGDEQSELERHVVVEKSDVSGQSIGRRQNALRGRVESVFLHVVDLVGKEIERESLPA